MLFENPEIKAKLEQEIDVLTETSTAIGLEELLLDLAEKKGIKKGQAEADAKAEYSEESTPPVSDESTPVQGSINCVAVPLDFQS